MSEEQPDAQTNTQIIEAMRPIVTGGLPLDQLGHLDRVRWERNLATYQSSGIIRTAPPLDQVLALELCR